MKMKKSLSDSSLVIMNTPESAERFTREFPDLGVRVTHITNGYDAEDFRDRNDRPGRDFFRIVHAGAFHTDAGLRQRRLRKVYNALGRTEEGVELLCRSHFYLMKAVDRWFEIDPEVREKVKLEFVGVPSSGDLSIVENSSAKDRVEFLGYLSHGDSLSKVMEANLLFLPMHGIHSGARATIVPGKSYEYMASGRPILGAVPKGDCRDFLERTGSAYTCDPHDIDGLVNALRQEFENWSENRPRTVSDPGFVENFERQVLTEKLAKQLDQVMGREPATRSNPPKQTTRIS
jgi:glycosyltransferase involved in cell wall biosynthesis